MAWFFVEYLKNAYRVKIYIRHAQRPINKFGYSLRRPMYRFDQAKKEGVEELGNHQKLQTILKKQGVIKCFFLRIKRDFLCIRNWKDYG